MSKFYHCLIKILNLNDASVRKCIVCHRSLITGSCPSEKSIDEKTAQ